jgi:hypothetical protein
MSPSAPDPAFSIETPHEREARIDDPILQVDPAVVADVAERALVDEALGQHHRRGTAIVVADHVQHARLADLGEHAVGLRDRIGQRLLAKHYLTGARCRDGNGRVQIARRADVDQVDVLAVDDGLPVGRRLFPAILAPGRLDFVFRASAQDLEAGTKTGCEERRDLPVGIAVRLAHEGVPDEGDIELCAALHLDSTLSEGR